MTEITQEQARALWKQLNSLVQAHKFCLEQSGAWSAAQSVAPMDCKTFERQVNESSKLLASIPFTTDKQ